MPLSDILPGPILAFQAAQDNAARQRAQQLQEATAIANMRRAQEDMALRRAASGRQNQLLEMQLAKYKQERAQKEAFQQFHTPENLQRLGIISGGQEQIQEGANAEDTANPVLFDAPQVVPQFDRRKYIDALQSRGLVPPTSVMQQAVTEEAARSREEVARARAEELHQYRMERARTEKERDQERARHNKELERQGRERLNRPPTPRAPGPLDQARAKYNELLMKLSRGEQLTAAEQNFLNTYQRVGAREQLMRDFMSPNAPSPVAAQPADYPQGAPPGLTKRADGKWVGINPATGKLEEWVNRPGVSASGVIK